MTDGGERSSGRTSGAFCPECGRPMPAPGQRTGSGDRRAQALCDRCFAERHDVVEVPAELDLTVCRDCGAVRQDGNWRDVEADSDYADVAIEALQDSLAIHVEAEDVAWVVDIEQVDATTLRLNATISGTLRERPFEETATVRTRIATGTCRRCGRIAGDDHAAIVQLRARERVPTADEQARARRTAEAYVTDRMSTGDRDAFISEVEETDDGLDIKLSRPSLGRGIAERIRRQLGGTVDHAETLVTEDEEGDPVYRVTSVVRLAAYRPGDLIDPGDDSGPVLVRSVVGAIKGSRLWDGTGYTAAVDETRPARIGHRSEATTVTLVAEEDEQSIQVLDPRTYESRTVRRPAGLNDETGTVEVIAGPETLHVLPPDDGSAGAS